MPLVQDNILNLPQPHYYDCYVDRYHASFHTIRIRMERFQEHALTGWNSLEVVFSGALFFEGAFNWTGGNIGIAESDDCLAVLNYAGILNTDSDPDEVDETLTAYRLFIIQTSTGHLAKLIAHHKDYAVNVIG